MSQAPTQAAQQSAPRGQRMNAGGPKPRIASTTSTGNAIVDWKDTEALRRFLSPNGKIQGRRRNGASAREQRLLSQAIKRARYMALIPYTSATL